MIEQEFEQKVRDTYEAAARIYCKKLGVDPDASLAETPEVPIWHGIAYELHDLSVKLLSLREAATAEPRIVLAH